MSAAAEPAVGFVGLGAMGSHMARRLVEAGRRVHVHDTDVSAVARAVEQGATAAGSAAAVAGAATIVLVSLPSPDVVGAVADELTGGGAMRVYVDLSTTGPETAERVARRMAAGGVGPVDAPVSGGVAGARDGRLTIMVSGAPGDVAAARPLLEILGSTIFVVGDRPGQGQCVKVINNLMSACSILITAEAASLGTKAGLDPRTLLEVVAASSGSNTAAAQKFPQQVLTRTFHQGFALKLMAKDVRLCLDEARRRQVPMLLGSAVEQLWNLGEASFPPDADFMEIVQMVERWSDATIAPGSAGAGGGG